MASWLDQHPVVGRPQEPKKEREQDWLAAYPVVDAPPRQQRESQATLGDYVRVVDSGLGRGIASLSAGLGQLAQAPVAGLASVLAGAAAAIDRGRVAAKEAVGIDAEPARQTQAMAQRMARIAEDTRTRRAQQPWALHARLGRGLEQVSAQSLAELRERDAQHVELAQQQANMQQAQGFMGTLGAVRDNPLAFTHTLAQSLPATLFGVGAGATAARSGAGLGTVSKVGIAAEAGLGAAQARYGVYEQASTMPLEQLQHSPRFIEILAATGGDGVRAQSIFANELADQVPVLAGAGTALGTVLTNRLFGGDATAKALTGGARVTLPETAKRIAQEAVEEGIQSVPEALASHGAMVQADPSQDFDLGGTVAQGMAAGLAMGAGGHGARYAMDRRAGPAEPPADETAPVEPPPAPAPIEPAQAQPAEPPPPAEPTEAQQALLQPVTITALDRAQVIADELDALEQQAVQTGTTPDTDARQQQLERELTAITGTWPAAVPGAPTRFSTEAGVSIDARYALIDASDLITSHTLDLRANPLYPQELQPRDRTRAASELQVSKIAQGLDPQRLGSSGDATSGAPIIGADGLVESGNARTIAIKRAYQAGGQRIEDYKGWLRDHASEFGLDPQAVDTLTQPVLVRVRQTPVNRAEFAKQANMSQIQRMSASEQALSDAARLVSLEGLEPADDGDFSSSRDFISQFMALLPTTEQAEMLEADGKLSTTGYRRIQNAVLAKAYGDSPTLRRMTESMDDNLRNVSKALVRVAPVIAETRGRMQAGALHEADIVPDLLQAVEGMAEMKDRGVGLEQELSQQDLSGPKYTAESQTLLRMLSDNIRSPRRIAEFLQHYHAALEQAGDPRQGDMLGPVPAPTRAELLSAAAQQGVPNDTTTDAQRGEHRASPPIAEPDRQQSEDAPGSRSSDQGDGIASTDAAGGQPGVETGATTTADQPGAAAGPVAPAPRRRAAKPAGEQPAIDREKLDRDFRVFPTLILNNLLERGEVAKLYKAAGTKGASGFEGLSMDDKAAAYVKFVEQGGKPVENLPQDYNAYVRSEERDIKVRRLQSDRVVHQENGKPFKSKTSAQQFQALYDLDGTHEAVEADGGFVLRLLPLAAQAEKKRLAEGRESYTEAQEAVAGEMGIGQTAEGEWDATVAQFDEMERRVRARLRGERDQRPEARKAETEEKQARTANRKQAATTSAADSAHERRIQIAADSVRELRKVDVERVLTQDGIDAAALGDYIKRKRPEFAAEVDEILAEIANKEPPAELTLTSPTPAQVVAQQEAAEAAKREAEAADRKAAEDERKRQERAEIARRSEAAADTLELGQDPMANLTGQQDIFSAAPAPAVSANTVFTEDAAAKARARLKSKLGRLNSGLDPEMMMDGITLAGYHIERGARTFTAYARAMLDDLGDGVRPYLKSWYMGVKYDPRAARFDGMDDAAVVESTDIYALTAQEIEDATGADARLERDSAEPAAERAVGDPVSTGARATSAKAGRTRGQAAGATGSGQPRDTGVSPGGAAADGNRGDFLVPGGNATADAASVDAGADFSERGGDIGLDGVSTDPIPAAEVVASAETGTEKLSKLERQRAADKVAVKPGDLGNIKATLPYLLEGQQEDVKKAEDRFAEPDGYGMLFANGTGTGKTFTGLGVIKRFARQGKTNTLIVVPDDKIAADWIESGNPLGLKITALKDTKDAGKGIVIATYANLGENDALAMRQWDLVVADEAHTLMQSADGKVTTYLANLRAITHHPDGANQRHKMLHREDIDKLSELSKRIDGNTKILNNTDTMAEMMVSVRAENAQLQQDADALSAKLREKLDEVKAEVKAMQGAKRARLLTLSATPFAYEFTVDWANGYLFDYNEGQASDQTEFRGYNQGSNRERFFMQHFGYSMRYNKLTKPDPTKVDTGLLQRNFNGWLRTRGALSARMLDVPADYDRRFVLVESGIGNQIDDALNWVSEMSREGENKNGFSALRDVINQKFDYLSRRYLLEAIKATEVVPIVRQHMAMGRKVVVFHDYKKGGGFNPFDIQVPGKAPEDFPQERPQDFEAYKTALTEFRRKFNGLVNAPLGQLASPIEVFRREFADVLLVNGDEKKSDLLARYKRFQDDDSGPQVMLVQSAKNKGWSGHDTTGKHQRVLINLGQPTAPTLAIQQEGRIYRTGQVTDAIMRYLNTGTVWEKTTFASTIAGRASTAENLGMGEQARALKDSFIAAFEESDAYPPGHEGEGKGGKERDKLANAAITAYDRAKTYYWATQKKNSKTKAQEGVDYFATPEPLGFKMAEWLGLRGGESSLEPSGGHGAIARWLPETSNRTVIEPSNALRARLAMAMDVSKDRIIDGTFEEHNIVNKYDGIAMNPPFGAGGKTAIEHLAKAATHLRDGGRIVALIPTGPAADKRFDQWMYGTEQRSVKPVLTDDRLGAIYAGDTIKSRAAWAPEAKVVRSRDGGLWVKVAGKPGETLVNLQAVTGVQPTGARTREVRPADGIYTVAEIKLPQVTFERAGTSVATRIVVLEKQANKDLAPKARSPIDLTDIADINELFDRLEDISLPPRALTPEQEAAVKAERAQLEADAAKAARQTKKADDKPKAANPEAVGTVERGELPIVEHTTAKGKVIRGVIRTDLTKEQAQAIDPYTWKKDGGYFIREVYLKGDDSPMMSRTPATGRPTPQGPATVEMVQQVVDAITPAWAQRPEIVIAQSMQDPAVPEAVRNEDAAQRKRGATGVPSGFYYQGKVYLIADGLSSPRSVVETLYHEALGHHGLRSVFGDSLDGILDQIALARPELMRAKAKQYGKANTLAEARAMVLKARPDLAGAALDSAAASRLQKHRREVAEEVLAEMAQTRPELGFVKRAVAAIRTWLRQNMPGLKNLALTDAEIINSFILPARNWVERGNRDGDAGGLVSFMRSAASRTQDQTKARKVVTVYHGASLKSLPGILKNGLVPRKKKNHEQSGGYVYVELNELTARAWATQAGGSEFAVLEIEIFEDDLTRDQQTLSRTSFRTGHAPKSQIKGWDVYQRIARTGEIEYVRNESNPSFRTIRQQYKQSDPTNSDIRFSRTQDQTQTEAFRRWFKDSMVVGPDGEPLVVYHGTGGERTVFEPYWKQLERDAMPHELKGNGSIAQMYQLAKEEPEMHFFAAERGTAESYGPDVVEAYLKIDNMVGDPSMDRDEAIQLMLDQDADGAIFRDTTSSGGYGGVAYVVRRSNQIKSAIGNRGTFDPANPDIRFSRSPATLGSNIPAWSAPEKAKWDDFVYKIQDRHVDLKRVTAQIKEVSGAIDDAKDTYLREEMYHSRVAKRIQDFINDELNPLVEDMRRTGVTMKAIERFMQARHAPEANAVIAQRNPGVPDLQDGGSGMTNAEAQAHMASLKPAERKHLESAAAKIDAIIKQTRQTLVGYELETQAVVDSWAQLFPNYVPLFREGHDDSFAPGIAQGFGVRGRETQSRTGSTAEVKDIFANIMMQRERAITRGEKNRVGQSLVALAESNPNADWWQVDSAPTKRVYDHKLGVVVNKPDLRWKERPNAVVVKFKSKAGLIVERAVVFNDKNERAKRMAAAMKSLDLDPLQGVMGIMASVTRYFAMINTQYNPVFGPFNMLRDIKAAMIQVDGTPIEKDRGKILSGIVPAIAGIYLSARKERKGKHQHGIWAGRWDEFQKVGGPTGFRAMFETSEDRAHDIRATMNPDWWTQELWGKVITVGGILEGPLKPAKRGMVWVLDWLSDYNLAIENGVRLAAYQAAIDRGQSKERAASLAKNLTINFNRRGQVGLQAGALYAFFNSAIQGTARMGETLTQMEPGKPKSLRLNSWGRKVVYGGLLLGAMQALAMAAAGFDDEDPPQFIRDRSLIIPLGNGRFWSQPLPLGYHVIPAIGRSITEFVLGGFQDPEERVMHVMELMLNAFNPLGHSGLSIQTIAPTPIDPLVALGENRDWTGRQIAQKSMNPATPGTEMASDQTMVLWRWMAAAINRLTGGNEFVAGGISPNPDQFSYLFGQITGGVGREAERAWQTGTAIVTGDEVATRRIPMVGRFVGSTRQQASKAATFRGHVQELNRLETEIRGLREAGRMDEARALRDSRPEARLITAANSTETRIRTLRNKRSELIQAGASREEVRAMNERITAEMLRFNEAMAKLKQPEQELVGD